MTQHPQAGILRAIADGKQIEDKTNTGYTYAAPDYVLRVLSNGGGQFLRIKPRTLSINGREFECPVEHNLAKSQWCVAIYRGPDEHKTFWHNTKEARDLHYKILVEESTPK